MATNNPLRAGLAVALVVLLVPAAGCSRRGDTDGPPNLVLISIDTLRADHLGFYGYERDTSPNLDAFARRSMVFLDAHATADKTAESHMSMFTSLFPSVHGVGLFDDGKTVRKLGPGAPSLAEILKDNGYRTVGFHAGGFVDAQFGFDRGFDSYQSKRIGHADEWLRVNARKGRFFLFFHTYDVHDPYTPSDEYARRFAAGYEGGIVHDRDKLIELAGSDDWSHYNAKFWELVDQSDPADVTHLEALYDAGIAQLDAQLGDLLATIGEVAPNTIVVVLSDHGEEFMEHGQLRHEQLHREITHVPLIINHPRWERGFTISHPVSLIDLAPTLLELLGLPPEKRFQGRSLLRELEGEPVEILAETPVFRRKALWDGSYKLLTIGRAAKLYHVTTDPQEHRDLSAEGAAGEELARLRRRLGQIKARHAELARALADRDTGTQLDADTREQLRALGYLQ